MIYNNSKCANCGIDNLKDIFMKDCIWVCGNCIRSMNDGISK